MRKVEQASPASEYSRTNKYPCKYFELCITLFVPLPKDIPRPDWFPTWPPDWLWILCKLSMSGKTPVQEICLATRAILSHNHMGQSINTLYDWILLKTQSSSCSRAQFSKESCTSNKKGAECRYTGDSACKLCTVHLFILHNNLDSKYCFPLSLCQ